MKHTRARCIAIVGPLLVAASALAPAAWAQSCPDPVTVHSSYPADGATAVPTNSPVIVYGPELDASDTDVTLQDASGEDVSVEVTSTEGGLYIDAFLGLAPSTTYALSVAPRGGGAWSATFRTGSGPANPAQVAAPDVGVSIIEQDLGSCGVVSAICVNGSVPARMTLEVVLRDEVMSLGGGEPAPAFPASAGSIASSACVEVRVREPGGFVSPSTRLCGDDIERFELASNAAAPRSCEPYRSTADEDEEAGSGCAIGGSGAGSRAGVLVLGLGALLMARRRRAR